MLQAAVELAFMCLTNCIPFLFVLPRCAYGGPDIKGVPEVNVICSSPGVTTLEVDGCVFGSRHLNPCL
eukprot:4315834-Pyramimonas_sp.AAC.1